MTDSLFETTTLEAAVHALRHDLLAEGGPKISTMRNYRFAILPYDPRQEFALRKHMRRLSDELTSQGWNVLSISLQRLLLDRLQAEEPRVIDNLRRTERRLYIRDPERALHYLKDKLDQRAHLRRHIRLCVTPCPTVCCMAMKKRANIAYQI